MKLNFLDIEREIKNPRHTIKISKKKLVLLDFILFFMLIFVNKLILRYEKYKSKFLIIDKRFNNKISSISYSILLFISTCLFNNKINALYILLIWNLYSFLVDKRYKVFLLLITLVLIAIYIISGVNISNYIVYELPLIIKLYTEKIIGSHRAEAWSPKPQRGDVGDSYYNANEQNNRYRSKSCETRSEPYKIPKQESFITDYMKKCIKRKNEWDEMNDFILNSKMPSPGSSPNTAFYNTYKGYQSNWRTYKKKYPDNAFEEYKAANWAIADQASGVEDALGGGIGRVIQELPNGGFTPAAITRNFILGSVGGYVSGKAGERVGLKDSWEKTFRDVKREIDGSF